MNTGIFMRDPSKDRQAHGVLTTLVTLLCDNATRYVCYLIGDGDHCALSAEHRSQTGDVQCVVESRGLHAHVH